MLRYFLRAIEQSMHCKIYRNGLPRGTSFGIDIDRAVGGENIRTILDIGANIGQSAVSFHEQFAAAQIWSFEPVLATFNALVSATRHLNRIHPQRLAMSDSKGDAEISIGSYSTTNSMAFGDGLKKEKVETETVDGFAVANHLRSIDVLKIDVEGYELNVLNGCRKLLNAGNIGFVYIESEPIATDQHFIDFQTLNEEFSGFKYELFGIYDQQAAWDGSKRLIYFNPVYVSPRIVDQTVNRSNYPLRFDAVSEK